MTRRRLLAATTAVSLGMASGCSTTDGTAEAPTAEVPTTENEASTDAPETESTGAAASDAPDTTEPEVESEPELPPEVSDLYVREEFGVSELPCQPMKAYGRVLRDGDFIIIAAARYAEQGCERFEFDREEFDDETNTLQLFVNWGSGGNENCEPECSRGKELFAAYDVDFDVKGVQLYVAEDGGEEELAEEWTR